MNKVIEINNLNVTYKKEDDPTIKNISFSLGQGKTFLILGESGSGKTTIINSILGNINGVIEGDIFINNKDIKTNNIFFTDASFISQTYPLYEEETLYRNVRVSYVNSFSYILEKYNLSREDFSDEDIKNISKKTKNANKIAKKIANKLDKKKQPNNFIDDKIKEYFKMFGLDFDEFYNKKPSSISGGQRQRIAMIKAVIREPLLIIMDEPFASLDKMNTSNIIKEINKLKKEKNISFIISTHDFDDIDGFEDDAILLSKETKTISSKGLIKDMSCDITNKISQLYFNENINEIDKQFFKNKETIFIKSSDMEISKKSKINSKGMVLKEKNEKRNGISILTFYNDKGNKITVEHNEKKLSTKIENKYYISLKKGVINDK